LMVQYSVIQSSLFTLT